MIDLLSWADSFDIYTEIHPATFGAIYIEAPGPIQYFDLDLDALYSLLAA